MESSAKPEVVARQRSGSPLLVLFIGILVVSTASVFIRLAQREASSIVIAAYRLTLSALILLPIALRGNRKDLARLNRKQMILVLLSGLFLALHFAAWITSLEYTSVASSVVLVTTTPLWVSLFSPVILGERPTRAVVAGMAVALTGGVMVGLSEACAFGPGGLTCPSFSEFVQGSAFAGNLLALAGALMASAYLMVGRWLRPSLSLVPYITAVYSVAAVVLLVMAVVSDQPLVGFSPAVYLAFFALAVGPQLLGHTALNYGLRYLSAAYVSVALLGEPIGTVILAYLVLNEAPTILEVVGGLIILSGILLASYSQKQPAETGGG